MARGGSGVAELFVVLAGTSRGEAMIELPSFSSIEGDEQIKGLVENALVEDGFEPATAASGDVAVTLLKSKSFIKERSPAYRALVNDINLKGEMTAGGRQTSPRDRSRVCSRLHDGRGCRAMGVARRAQQHLTHEALRSRSPDKSAMTLTQVGAQH